MSACNCLHGLLFTFHGRRLEQGDINRLELAVEEHGGHLGHLQTPTIVVLCNDTTQSDVDKFKASGLRMVELAVFLKHIDLYRLPCYGNNCYIIDREEFDQELPNRPTFPQYFAQRPALLGYQPINSRALPPVTTKFFKLRFTLMNHKVFRLITLPSNYSFFFVHLYIQFLFGWTGDHLHQIELRKHAVEYAAAYKRGELKDAGGVLAQLRARMSGGEEEEEDEEAGVYGGPEETRERDRLGPKRDHEGDPILAERKVMLLDLFGRQGQRKDRGAIYDYDGWKVHITLDGFVECPSGNLPIYTKGKGAPPAEYPDALHQSWDSEDPPSKKITGTLTQWGAGFGDWLTGDLISWLDYKGVHVGPPKPKEKEKSISVLSTERAGA